MSQSPPSVQPSKFAPDADLLVALVQQAQFEPQEAEEIEREIAAVVNALGRDPAWEDDPEAWGIASSFFPNGWTSPPSPPTLRPSAEHWWGFLVATLLRKARVYSYRIWRYVSFRAGRPVAPFHGFMWAEDAHLYGFIQAKGEVEVTLQYKQRVKLQQPLQRDLFGKKTILTLEGDGSGTLLIGSIPHQVRGWFDVELLALAPIKPAT